MIIILRDSDRFLDNNREVFLEPDLHGTAMSFLVKEYLQFEQIYGSNFIRTSLFNGFFIQCYSVALIVHDFLKGN